MFLTHFLHRAKEEEIRRLKALTRAEKNQLHIQERQIVEKAEEFGAFLKVRGCTRRLSCVSVPGTA